MRIIVLGSGTGDISSKRTAPGHIIEIGSKFLLFDSGSGTTYKFPKAGISKNDISHIFYSHIKHPDHFNDFSQILFVSKYDEPKREVPLYVYGPKGIKQHYEKIKELYPILSDLPFDLEISELEDDTVSIPDLGAKVFAKPVSHMGVEALGYRIEAEGKIVTYSGDTGFCKNIIELAKNSDLFICECAVPNELPKNGHLTPKEIGEIARIAKCKKVLLVHLTPLWEKYDIEKEIKESFLGEFIVSKDLLTMEVL